MLTHSDVITAFGGVRPLAEAIGVDPKRAIHWSQRGIPAKYWPLVEAVAVERKISITARVLMDLPTCAPTTPPHEPAADVGRVGA